MNQTLHIRRRSRALMTGFLFAASGFVLLLLWMSVHSETKSKPGFVLFMACGTIFVLAIATWSVIEIWRHAIETDSERIVSQRAVGHSEMRWKDIEAACWHVGKVELKGAARRLEILYRKYDRDDARLLIEAIRNALPAGVQRDERRAYGTARDRDSEWCLGGDKASARHEGAGATPPTRPVEFRPKSFVARVALRKPLNGTVEERIEIQAERIIQRSWPFQTEFRWDELRKMFWNAKSRTIDLVSDLEILPIRLRSQDPERQLALIRLLRAGLPRSIQTDWPMFCHRIALPLREPQPPEPPLPAVPGPEEFLNTRGRVDRWMVLAFLVALGSFGVAWQATSILKFEGRLWFLASILLSFFVVFWIGLRFGISPQGRVDKAVRRNSEEWSLVLLIFGMVIGLPIAVGALNAALRAKRFGIAHVVVILCLLLGAFVVVSYRRLAPQRRLWAEERGRERELQKEALKRAATESARRWEQLEAEASFRGG